MNETINKIIFSEEKSSEIYRLEKQSILVLIYLTFVIIICTVILMWLQGTCHKLTICVFAAILGSTSSALLSALQRKSNGWELIKDKEHKKNEDSTSKKKEKYNLSMSSFFIFRPFLGCVSGIIIFYGYSFSVIFF